MLIFEALNSLKFNLNLRLRRSLLPRLLTWFCRCLRGAQVSLRVYRAELIIMWTISLEHPIIIVAPTPPYKAYREYLGTELHLSANRAVSSSSSSRRWRISIWPARLTTLSHAILNVRSSYILTGPSVVFEVCVCLGSEQCLDALQVAQFNGQHERRTSPRVQLLQVMLRTKMDRRKITR